MRYNKEVNHSQQQKDTPLHVHDASRPHGEPHTCSHHHAPCERGQVHGFVLSSWSQIRILGIVFALNVAYAWVEACGSQNTHSWALMSDAVHMAADASGLLLAFLGAMLSLYVQKNHDYLKAWWIERLAAGCNALALSGMSVFLWVEGGQRLSNPPQIVGESLLWIAIGGLLVNLLSVYLLHQDSHHHLNIRGAYLHVISDALGSVAAIISAVGVLVFHIVWMDAVMSLLVAGLVTWVAIGFVQSLWRSFQEAPSEDAFEHPLLHAEEDPHETP
jgi:cobalt-zinc-cadmium efflux system protein